MTCVTDDIELIFIRLTRDVPVAAAACRLRLGTGRSSLAAMLEFASSRSSSRQG
jgi:hypothetical protein